MNKSPITKVESDHEIIQVKFINVEKNPLFIKPLSELKVPLLLLGSRGDEMTRPDFQEEYEVMAGETGAEICLLSEGGHPAILSKAEQAAEFICKFLH